MFLDLLSLVAVFLVDDVVAESSYYLKRVLLGYASLILYLLLRYTSCIFNLSRSQVLLLIKTIYSSSIFFQFILGYFPAFLMTESHGFQFIRGPLLQFLDIIKHLIGILHLLQILQRKPILIRHFLPTPTQQFLQLNLITSNQVDILLLIDLSNQPASQIKGRDYFCGSIWCILYISRLL